MHGVKRQQYDEAVAKARKQAELLQIQTYRTACEEAEKFRQANELTNEALEATEKALSINPEHYSFWNFRKRIFLQKFKSSEIETEILHKECTKELEFIVTCIQRHPKSYWVWHQRLWLIEKMPNPNWLFELKLCNKMLDLDTRNFHCWDYRRKVVAHIPNRGPIEELEYTFQKISQNFSNYSAWHLRSKLLPIVYPSDQIQVQQDSLQKEFDLVKNAVFTEPADQSPWLYHRWLLGRYTESMKEEKNSEGEQVMRSELASIRELLELEPDSKWPLLTIAFILHVLGEYDESISIFTKLEEIDPYRQHFYRDFKTKLENEKSIKNVQ